TILAISRMDFLIMVKPPCIILFSKQQVPVRTVKNPLLNIHWSICSITPNKALLKRRVGPSQPCSCSLSPVVLRQHLAIAVVESLNKRKQRKSLCQTRSTIIIYNSPVKIVFLYTVPSQARSADRSIQDN